MTAHARRKHSRPYDADISVFASGAAPMGTLEFESKLCSDVNGTLDEVTATTA